jgi:hypothetical protein
MSFEAVFGERDNRDPIVALALMQLSGDNTVDHNQLAGVQTWF